MKSITVMLISNNILLINSDLFGPITIATESKGQKKILPL